MKQYLVGMLTGVLIVVLGFLGFNLLSAKSSAAQNQELKSKNIQYTYVDFRYQDLVLSDVGIAVDGQLYIEPNKLLSFLGKQIKKDERSNQMVIAEKPENTILESSTAALGQYSKSTIGEMLNKRFQSQHWDADPEEENKLVFSGTDLNKNHYEIVFWINSANEMTIQSILVNGTELSERARVSEMKKLFSN